ncbi:MAG: fused MFS/spermidine synthase [Bacteriovoracaceae bacterium]|nr:fused MFS/spermidine synthase [Bacteriovoracaceae bacterium]
MSYVIYLCITSLGISALITQFVFLREFLTLFSGNELTIGLVLGNWALLQGTGAFIGQFGQKIKNTKVLLIICQFILAILPLLLFWALTIYKSIIVVGISVGLFQAFWLSFVGLLPICLLSGALMTFFVFIITKDYQEGAGVAKIYFLDSLGDLVGGLLFSFCLVYFLDSFQTLVLLCVINLLVAAVLTYYYQYKSLSIVATLLAIVVPVVIVSGSLEEKILKAQYPTKKILLHQSTPYGVVAITEDRGQVSIYENGTPIASIPHVGQSEEIVHYAMIQHPLPKRVLLVSGGVNNLIFEVAKYHDANSIDLVEQNPLILALAKKQASTITKPKVNFISGDAIKFLANTSGEHKYDVVIIDLPDPINAQIGRFYTQEFFKIVKGALGKGGILSFALSSSANYDSEELKQFSSSVYKALANCFEQIIIIPGGQNYFLASASALSYNIGDKIKKEKLDTKFVNSNYLKSILTPDRLRQAKVLVQSNSLVNRDLSPIGYYYHFQYWLKKLDATLLIPILLILGIVIVVFILLAKSSELADSFTLLSSSFSAMGMQVILILLYQIRFGYLYNQLSFIITCFILGLAIGAFFGSKLNTSRLLLKADFLIVLFIFVIVIGPLSSAFATPVYNTLFGILLGGQLAYIAKTSPVNATETAGFVYALDFLGGALGAFLISAFMIPYLGIHKSLLIIMLIKITSILGLVVIPKVTSAYRPFKDVNLEQFLSYGLMLFIFWGIGLSMVIPKTNAIVYAFSLRPWLHYVLLIILAWKITVAYNPKWQFNVKYTSWIYFFAFWPLAIYPLFRCYFSVPYIFCHACPRKCVFGIMRAYFIPAALLINLDRQMWCYGMCPIGTLEDGQAQICRSSLKKSKLISFVSAVIVIVVIGLYIKVDGPSKSLSSSNFDWYNYFFHNSYTTSATIVGAVIFFNILSIFIRRSFCRLLCPIGIVTNFSRLAR